MLRALPAVLVLAVLSLAFAFPAQAVLITVNFTVSGDNSGAVVDPVYGSTTASGSFSFDSSLIPPLPLLPGNVSNSSTGVDVSAIDFTWAGHTWSTADADAAQLRFDAAGNLTGWLLGGVPAGLLGMSNAVFPDFSASYAGTFSYTTSDSPIGSGGRGVFDGTVTTWSFTTGSVPEPASWLLLGGALVGLVGVRRRARK